MSKVQKWKEKRQSKSEGLMKAGKDILTSLFTNPNLTELAITGGCAYAGYRAFNKNPGGLLFGGLAYKLATCNEGSFVGVSHILGLAMLAFLGVTNMPRVDPQADIKKRYEEGTEHEKSEILMELQTKTLSFGGLGGTVANVLGQGVLDVRNIMEDPTYTKRLAAIRSGYRSAR